MFEMMFVEWTSICVCRHTRLFELRYWIKMMKIKITRISTFSFSWEMGNTDIYDAWQISDQMTLFIGSEYHLHRTRSKGECTWKLCRRRDWDWTYISMCAEISHILKVTRNLHKPLISVLSSLLPFVSRDCLFLLSFFFAFALVVICVFLFNFYSIKWHQFHPSVAIFSFYSALFACFTFYVTFHPLHSRSHIVLLQCSSETVRNFFTNHKK